jgi:uncharacterized protein with HEPN domain
MNRDPGTLLDILLACRDIKSYTHGFDLERFKGDRLVHAATPHQLTIIGEATKRLSSKFRHHHPAIPWSQMAGMRDHLVHAYDKVNLELIWRTATVDVPRLRQELEPLIAPEASNPILIPF